MEWRTALLDGIDALAPRAAGRVLTLKQTAEPIFAGPNVGDVVIAAAELGKGRIVLLTHSGYLDDFWGTSADPVQSKLHSNIKKWVTRGQFTSNSEFIDGGCRYSGTLTFGGPVKGIYQYGGMAAIPSQDVMAFVSAGGALVCGITVWGWLQGAGRTVDKIPHLDVLLAAGLCPDDGYNSGDKAAFAISANKAADSHFLRNLLALSDIQNNADRVAALGNGFQFLGPKLSMDLASYVKPLAVTAFNFVDSAIRAPGFPIPRDDLPLEDKGKRGLLDLWFGLQQGLQLEGVKAPGCEIFPGDFAQAPSLSTSDVMSITSAFPISAAFSTGWYVPAGTKLVVELLSENISDAAGWSVAVGAHSDSNVNCTKLNRWAVVCAEQPLTKQLTTVFSPFGGLVYFWSPKRLGTIKVRLQNVVRAPTFRLGDDLTAWQTTVRNLPGLWADLTGKYVRFTLPSSSIRKLDDPTAALQFWDSLLTNYHRLRCTDIDGKPAEWVVADEQPCAGYMHAGYPIVTGLDICNKPDDPYFVMNAATIKTGNFWGLFHEFGHNMQRYLDGSKPWTFDNTGEVTVNIFSMFGMETLCGMKAWIVPWLAGHLSDVRKDVLDSNVVWPNSSSTDLFLYAQLARDFGWDCYQRVFSHYATNPPSENQDKIDQWFLNFSKEAGLNLRPLAVFWKIPLSASAVQQLDQLGLPSYLPDDEMTQYAPARTIEVVNAFPGIKRSVK